MLKLNIGDRVKFNDRSMYARQEGVIDRFISGTDQDFEAVLGNGLRAYSSAQWVESVISKGSCNTIAVGSRSAMNPPPLHTQPCIHVYWHATQQSCKTCGGSTADILAGVKFYVPVSTPIAVPTFVTGHTHVVPQQPVIVAFDAAVQSTLQQMTMYPVYGSASLLEECEHSWKEYVGLQEVFHYCSKCDQKQT